MKGKNKKSNLRKLTNQVKSSKPTYNVDTITSSFSSSLREAEVAVEDKFHYYEDVFHIPHIPKSHIKKIYLAKTFKIFIIVLLALSLFFAGGIYAYGEVYENKTFLGSTVLNEDMSSKNKEEIQNFLNSKVSNYSLIINALDKEFKASADDLGVSFKIDEATGKAFNKGREGNIFNKNLERVKLLLCHFLPKYFKADSIKLEYEVDENKLNIFIDKISKEFNLSPQNAGLVMQGTDVQIVSAVYGRKVIVENLKEQIKNSLDSLSIVNVRVASEDIKPEIVDTETNKAIELAKIMISKKIVLKYNDQNYTPSGLDIASWIVFNETNDGKKTLRPIIDTNKAKSYLAWVATKIDIPAQNRKVRIENGVREVLLQEGKEGLAVDQNAVANQIKSSLEGYKDLSMAIPTYKVSPKTETERVIVLDWGKYIEINLSQQRLIAYENKQPINSFLISSGTWSHPTPTGTYAVYSKSRVTRMTGGTPGYDYYDLPGVEWVCWFHGGYSIHGCYWHSNFGHQMSHGCVNASNGNAQWVYNWTPVGTPVVVHY